MKRRTIVHLAIAAEKRGAIIRLLLVQYRWCRTLIALFSFAGTGIDRTALGVGQQTS